MLYQAVKSNAPLCICINLGNMGGASLFHTMFEILPKNTCFTYQGEVGKPAIFSAELFKSAEFITGHFGADDCVAPYRNVELMTLVRNPMRHFVSAYNFCLGHYCGSNDRWTDKPRAGWKERRDKLSPNYLQSLESIDSYISYRENTPNFNVSLIGQINNYVLQKKRMV